MFGAGGLFAEFEDIQEFILNIAKVVADDARGILMRNRFAEAIILQEGGQYEAHNRIPCSAQKAPEQHLSDACREIKTIFQEAEQQVNAHHGGGCKQHPPDQPVQVKLPDKRI